MRERETDSERETGREIDEDKVTDIRRAGVGARRKRTLGTEGANVHRITKTFYIFIWILR